MNIKSLSERDGCAKCMMEIHSELEGLNKEANKLMEQILPEEL